MSVEDQGRAARVLQRKTVEWMAEKPGLLRVAMIDSGLSSDRAYLDALAQGTVWPGEAELLLLSRRLPASLEVHQPGQRSRVYGERAHRVHLAFSHHHYDLLVQEP